MKTLALIFMGTAHYIVLEGEIEGLDTAMDGKALSHNIDALDAAARELGVRPLSEFFSMDPAHAAEFMDGADDIEMPPLQQFSAEEGLATIRALMEKTAADSDHVLDDLRNCERILSAAAQHGVGWHFEIDI